MRSIFLLFIALVVLVVLIGSVYFIWQIGQLLDSEGSEVLFVIKKGQGVKEIAKNLEEQQIIKSQFILETYVFLKGLDKKFLAGQYRLSAAMDIRQIVGILTSRAGSGERTIRILEGWNIQEIAEYLENQGVASKEEFIREVSNLEGYLFPDTYRIYQDASAKDIVKKLLDNFDKKLTAEIRQEIKKQGKTIFEIIIMASLIEKEAATDEDRGLISGIFYKRIALGQALQSCATINYILGTRKRQLSFEETRTPSLYNTYLHPGLPPGPICSPGLAVIKAAIWPEDSEYWYFLSRPDGQTIYSKTKEEHDRNKSKYLK